MLWLLGTLKLIIMEYSMKDFWQCSRTARGSFLFWRDVDVEEIPELSLHAVLEAASCPTPSLGVIFHLGRGVNLLIQDSWRLKSMLPHWQLGTNACCHMDSLEQMYAAASNRLGEKKHAALSTAWDKCMPSHRSTAWDKCMLLHYCNSLGQMHAATLL